MLQPRVKGACSLLILRWYCLSLLAGEVRQRNGRFSGVSSELIVAGKIVFWFGGQVILRKRELYGIFSSERLCAGFHFDRTAGDDRDHRDFGESVAACAGACEKPRAGSGMQKQPAADRPGVELLYAGSFEVSAELLRA